MRLRRRFSATRRKTGGGSAARVPRFAFLLRALALAAGLAVLPVAADAIAWKLPTYTLVARDMNLRTALDTFAVAEGLSIVMSEAVVGTFSGDFRDIPAGEFLNRIAT